MLVGEKATAEVGRRSVSSVLRSREAPVSDSIRFELVRPSAAPFDEARLAVAAFLARYGQPTRAAYACELRCWITWCDAYGLPAFGAQHGHVELWARDIEEGRGLATLAGFYRVAVIDVRLEHTPWSSCAAPRSPRDPRPWAWTAWNGAPSSPKRPRG
jgi:hypothetical protein